MGMEGKHCAIILIVSLCLGQTLAYRDEETDSLRTWLAQKVPNWANMFLPMTADANSSCHKALQVMRTSLDNNELWAARIADSWPKFPDGLFVGNWFMEGSIDECLRTSSPDGSIWGKYCRVYVVENVTEEDALSQGKRSCEDPISAFRDQHTRMPVLYTFSLDLPATYSTCIPDPCSEEELEESVTSALENRNLSVKKVECRALQDPNEYTAGDIAFITLLSFFLFLMVAASVVDIFIEKTKNKTLGKGGVRFLLPFSVYTNLGKLFQLNTKKSAENITCLHGIRVLSMIWVIYGHQHSAGFYYTANGLQMFPKTSGFLYQVLSNAFFSVDTFFFLSGFLLAYVLLRELGRTNRFNIPMFYIHRFVRLLPPIAIATGLFATVARYFATGPMSGYWDMTRSGCIRFWWKDLVFLNNFFMDSGDPEVAADCIGQAWYLAVDTQLYIVAPLIILPLHYYKAAGQVWLYFLTIVSVIIPAAITYALDLEPTMLMLNPTGYDFFMKVYVTPWCRAGPWLIGIWLGYVFHVQGQKEVILKRWQVVAGWTVSTITAFLLVMGVWSYNVYPPKADYDVMTQVSYSGLSRPAWGVVLAWIIYACHHGYGGPVDGFLSHPSWQPLSRITYSTYLVAMQIQFLITFATKSPLYFTPLTVLMQTVAGVIISCIVGVLLSLTAEAPIIGLEKLLLRRPGHGGDRGTSKPKGHDNEAFKNETAEAPHEDVDKKAPMNENSLENGIADGTEKVTKF